MSIELAALSPQAFANASLAQIVGLVRTGEARTRLELIERTGLGRAIVRQRVDLAISLGLIDDDEIGTSTGGRVPRLLRFGVEQGYFALMALGASSVAVGVSDLNGEILRSRRFDWDIATGPDETLAVVTAAVRGELAHLPDRPVWGVAMGLPGPVEFASGRPVAPPIMPGWGDADVRGRLEQAFGAPAWVDNDVNVLALGESRQRDSADAENLLYVKVGSGIGAGLVSHRAVHRGANGAAGDIGHVAVAGSTTLCRCGQVGCLEATVGGWALVRDAEIAARQGQSPLLAQVLEERGHLVVTDLVDAVRAGDPYTIAVVTRAARTIGETLATIVNVFNPSLIVLGGVVVRTGEAFLAAVREAVYRRSLPLATRDLRIVRPESEELDGLKGAAALVGERLFGALLPEWVADGSPVGLSASAR